ncbi:CTLH/CRA C-terminal to lish motif domain-containing protein [Auriculariales sp. MPI-PUGE-AT-0066]|nr:CTLH/CRA C-terminal to lish motif domain-containing protein [Auriculariales sp. MPI-PUGE-AT-0066]
MDYLVIEGYRSAAEEFAREADVPGDQLPDFDGIASRMAVRDAVARGDVQEAIERVNDLNPEILDTNPTLFFHLQQQRLIEYIRAGAIEDALAFAQAELAPRGEENKEFLTELERTMALLAFGGGGGDLLTQGQRARTANELNAAILNSLSQGPEPRLTGLTRLLAWGELLLAERAEFPRFELPLHTHTPR